MMKELGFGEGYRYAHDLEEGIARMDCLPESLVGRRFYRPTGRGYEGRIAERLETWRSLLGLSESSGEEEERTASSLDG